MDEPQILVTHHKDGNRKNNRQENLLVVCPNCHVRIHKGVIQV
ncbi:MAG: HNH endonuclease [Chloroflexi bacterium]|nr:HNH endonuclease [Chloroflexota bacterium]